MALVTGVLATQAFNSFTPERHELHGALSGTPPVDSADFALTMSGLFGSNLLGGNQITTLINGDEIFPAMLEAIEGATTSINFETYVYWSGEVADDFARALAEKAQAGVEVRVLLDWQGSVPMEPELIEMMTKAGVLAERFRPVRWYTLDKINNRTHRKLLIVDGQVGFTGGVGIADEWRGQARSPDEWRDTHFRVEGPVVAEFQGAFADNWVEATGQLLRGEDYFPAIEPGGEVPAQLISSGAGEQNATHLMTMVALSSARETIRIATPYFVPDDIAMAQLLEARRRGVEVIVLLPGDHTNKDIVRSASRHFWGGLLEAGVRFYEFAPTMFHAKSLVIDDAWASVGSANFDERSFRLNDEANLNVFDPAFVAEQIAVFEADLERSREVSLGEWEARPLTEKFGDWLFSHLRVQL